MPNVVLGPFTQEEREAFIDSHLDVCTRSARRPRYNTNTSGRALRGTMSVHSAKRKCAAKQWKKKVKRRLLEGV